MNCRDRSKYLNYLITAPHAAHNDIDNDRLSQLDCKSKTKKMYDETENDADNQIDIRELLSDKDLSILPMKLDAMVHLNNL